MVDIGRNNHFKHAIKAEAFRHWRGEREARKEGVKMGARKKTLVMTKPNRMKMNLCIDCKHCRDHLAIKFEGRLRKMLEREGLCEPEWVDIFADTKSLEYLCDHPKVVDMSPVNGGITFVYCHKARGIGGSCGKAGVLWSRKEERNEVQAWQRVGVTGPMGAQETL